MKLNIDIDKAILSNAGPAGEFRIRNSAKAFSILSSGLYSNKIRAIIRELSCNATDSHVAAGKNDEPFELHLPSVLEPWFSIRDYGVGLSADEVVNIYTTYFESTKTESNDYIGALGLGSKSPFSYTDNFTITAVKNGIQNIYTAFINDHGIPSVVLMGTCQTDDPTGVEIKFSVDKSNDYTLFSQEAIDVLKWFSVKPKIVGRENFSINDVVYKEKDIVPGVSYSLYLRRPVAVMGNIAYPLNNMPDPYLHLGELSHLLKCPLVIEFDIGELDFAASREELSYVPYTIKSIKDKLTLLNKGLFKFIENKVAAGVSEWHKSEIIYTYKNDPLYSAAVIDYVHETNFKLFRSSDYYTYGIGISVNEIESFGLQVSAFTLNQRKGGTVARNPKKVYDKTNLVEMHTIPVSTKTVIVLNDTKAGCLARAKHHFSKSSTGVNDVFCVTYKGADISQRDTAFSKFLSRLSDPPCVIKASALESISKPSSKYDRPEALVLTRSKYEGMSWTDCAREFDDSSEYVYVPLYDRQPTSDTVDRFQMNQYKLAESIWDSRLPGVNNFQIYGVRKKDWKKAASKKNWIKLEDKVKNLIEKLPTDDIESVIAHSTIYNFNNLNFIETSVANLLPSGNDYKTFCEKYSNSKIANININSAYTIFSHYVDPIKFNCVKSSVESVLNSLRSKYPLLKHLHVRECQPHDVASYINLVDKNINSN